MTIVMQHQYENLIVDKKSFCITLSFNGKKESLIIPFDSISCFADPSTNFVLKLESYDFNENIIQSYNSSINDESDEMFTLHDSSLNNDTYLHNNVVDLLSFRKNKKDT
jgi:hypothetical protein